MTYLGLFWGQANLVVVREEVAGPRRRGDVGRRRRRALGRRGGRYEPARMKLQRLESSFSDERKGESSQDT